MIVKVEVNICVLYKVLSNFARQEFYLNAFDVNLLQFNATASNKNSKYWTK